MKASRPLMTLGVLVIAITALAQENRCEDKLVGQLLVDPKLDSAFFRKTTSSWPWHIVEHKDGTLEDTSGDKINKATLKKIEHMAECTSSHQGEHAMDYCDAELSEGKLILSIHGGMPAYASWLKIVVEGDRFTCQFHARYPAPTTNLNWRITKKELRVKSDKAEVGARFYAWLSVEFEESALEKGEIVWHPYKIEGYVKPIIQKAARKP